jgi:hypothetical protein
MIISKGKLYKIFSIIIISLFAVIYIFPLIVMVTTSFKTYNEAFDPSIGIFPKSLYLGNYIDVFNTIPFMKYFGNTMWITLMNVFGTILVTPMIAYSLSKIRWAGRSIIFAIITATMMIPYTAIMIPLYRMWVKVGLVGTFWPLIIPAFFGHPLYIIILRQFMLGIPDELLEASRIDGCNAWQRFCLVALPLVRPGIATITIFSFMYTFSDFLGPLLYANKGELYTLSLGLYSFMNEHTINWTSLMAAATIFMIPILIIFLIGQKQFVEGISTSGLKG